MARCYTVITEVTFETEGDPDDFIMSLKWVDFAASQGPTIEAPAGEIVKVYVGEYVEVEED